MRPFRIDKPFSFIGFLILPFLFLASCGGESAEAPAGGVDASGTDVPAAQAAFDESIELWSTDGAASILKLEEAIDLDPDFLDAYALLSNRYAWIHQNWDRADSIAEKTLALAEKAVELDPEAERSLRAMGNYYYRVKKDYPKAMEIYDRGAELYPESQTFLRMGAHVARREGDWDRALTILLRSEEIGPSLDAIQAIAENHKYNRRWDEAVAAYEEHARRAPESTLGPSEIAWIAFNQHGDLGPIREFLGTRPTGWALPRWNMEMLSRDYEAALAAMDASSTEVFNWQQGLGPRSVYRGIALRNLGREEEAVAAFEEALQTMESWLPESEDDCRVFGALAEIYTNLGMRDEAVEAAEHALALLPPEKDALLGQVNVMNMAQIYALLGEADPAVDFMEQALSMPGDLSLWSLRVAPLWDAVRDNARFQALIQE